MSMPALSTDLLVIGGGVGGCDTKAHLEWRHACTFDQGIRHDALVRRVAWCRVRGASGAAPTHVAVAATHSLTLASGALDHSVRVFGVDVAEAQW